MPENLKTEPVKADLTDIRIIIGAALGLIGVFLLIIALTSTDGTMDAIGLGDYLGVKSAEEYLFMIIGGPAGSYFQGGKGATLAAAEANALRLLGTDGIIETWACN